MKSVIVISFVVGLSIVPSLATDASRDGQACTRPNVAGVDQPWITRRGRDIRTTANRIYVMSTDIQIIPCCGRVVGWRYQASVRARVRPITFTVWRRVMSDKTGNRLQLVGQSTHWYMKGKSRSVEIRLPDHEYIRVQSGDSIGWHSPKGDVVAYAPSSPSLSCPNTTTASTLVWDWNTSSIPLECQIDLTQGKTLGRVYGVQAIVEPVPSPEFVQPPQRLSVKCPLPVKSHVINLQTKGNGKEEDATFDVYGYNPWFNIDTISGKVTTAMPISGNATHEITFTAKSSCGLLSYLTFIIQCIEIHHIRVNMENSRPRLTNLPSNVTILENESTVGDIVFTIAIEDDDVAVDDISFSWYTKGASLDAGPMFYLNRTSGEVTLQHLPRLSLGQTFRTDIVVTAFDGQVKSDPAILTITIWGQNDTPQFVREVFQVSINESQVGTPIFIFGEYVNDDDPGETLTFALTERDNEQEEEEHTTRHLTKPLFISNGKIRIKQGYDIDLPGNPSRFTIGLKVTDVGELTGESTLKIVIHDDNDNAPVVENDGTSFYISQDVYPGMRIGQIQATDLDSGPNGKLYFQVIGSTLNDTSQYFAIASASGWLISTGQSLPGEWTSLYIAVSDQGTPPLITMTVVNIITMPNNNNGNSVSSDNSASTTITTTTTSNNYHENHEGIDRNEQETSDDDVDNDDEVFVDHLAHIDKDNNSRPTKNSSNNDIEKKNHADIDQNQTDTASNDDVDDEEEFAKYLNNSSSKNKIEKYDDINYENEQDTSSDDDDEDDDEVFAEHLLNKMKVKAESGLEEDTKTEAIHTEPHSNSQSERKTAILILIAICCTLFAAVVALGYQLLKANKLLRSLNSNGHNSSVHHEFRFPWIPRQISVEDEPATRNINNQTHEFLGRSVINPNYSYQPVSLHQDTEAFSRNNRNPFTSNHKEGINYEMTQYPDQNLQLESNNKTMTIISTHSEDEETYHCSNQGVPSLPQPQDTTTTSCRNIRFNPFTSNYREGGESTSIEYQYQDQRSHTKLHNNAMEIVYTHNESCYTNEEQNYNSNSDYLKGNLTGVGGINEETTLDICVDNALSNTAKMKCQNQIDGDITFEMIDTRGIDYTKADEHITSFLG